jgi:uncharacterized protein YkwD
MKRKIFCLIVIIFNLLQIFSLKKDASDDLFILNEKVKSDDFLTALEKSIIIELNSARTDPKKYAEYLKEYKKYYKGYLLIQPDSIPIKTNEGVKAVDEAVSFLENAEKLPPLKLSMGLSKASAYHVKDTGEKGSVGHSSSDGKSPFQRMNMFGKWSGTAGENIDYGNNKAREILFSLIIDDGVSSRGHRTNIFNKNYKVIGIAFGTHLVYRYMTVFDFAQIYTEN